MGKNKKVDNTMCPKYYALVFVGTISLISTKTSMMQELGKLQLIEVAKSKLAK